MAARVIHFGWDDCYRIDVLRMAGYDVREVDTLDELAASLEQGGPVCAVFVSEVGPHTTESAAELVRSRHQTPVLLFRRSTRELNETRFDRVYPWVTPPRVWLAEIAQLVAGKLQKNGKRASAGPETLWVDRHGQASHSGSIRTRKATVSAIRFASRPSLG